MRILSKLLTGTAGAAAALAMAAAPALADPPPGVTPRSSDVVGVGARSTQYVWDQLTVDYNSTHKHPWIYSWDGGVGVMPLTLKQGCRPVARGSVSGSSTGIAALAAGKKSTSGSFCIDFVRSERARKVTDKPLGPGGVAFVTFAREAITFASRIASKGGSNAPTNLTAADLTKIYTCTVRTWNKVGGKSHATIVPVLPQSGSDIGSAFLSDIAVTTPGPCVVSTATLGENDGTAAVFNNANAIVPFSIGVWLAQEYRSPVCGQKPKKGQNEFGCDLNGFVGLNSINGTRPTLRTGSRQVINPGFSARFFRFLYDVVRYATNTPTHIPAYLEPFFNPAGAKIPGWICSSKAARADVVAYGFLNSRFCGSVS